MKKMIYMSVLALIAAGSIFWSCQKDETLTNPEEGLMLKSGTDCCVTSLPSAPENVYTNVTFGITITAYNDASTTYVTISRASGNMTIRYANPGLVSTQTTRGTVADEVTTHSLSFPNPTGWTCGDPVTFSFYLNGLGGGTPNTLQTGVITYNLKDLCPTDCEEVNASAYAGNTIGENSGTPGKGFNNAWWYAFDTEGDAVQDILTGGGDNPEVIGTVTYDESTQILTLDLGSWNLQNGSESVKYYLYDVLPTEGRPTPGQAPYKGGSDLVIDSRGYKYIVAHLDVTTCR